MASAFSAARLACAAALLLLSCGCCLAAPDGHRVGRLPGLEGPLPSAMFSGYLVTGEHHVHYMLVESEGSPLTDPLVIWFNGGPGASSLVGFFQELGPVVLQSNSSVIRNPYAWSKVANVLYFESPTGVGFSHCEASRQGGSCIHNDTSTAQLNMDSLRRFLELYPEYHGRDFMIWGESYAGVYIPTLAELIYDNGLPVRFVGFGVGDPCTSESHQHIDDQLVFNLKFALANGFMPSVTYDFIEQNCVRKEPGVAYILPDYTREGCRAAWRTYYIATSDADESGPDAKLPHGGFLDPYSAFGPNTGDYDAMLAEYLDSDVVRAALHVEGAPSDAPWAGGNRLGYTRQYRACFYDMDMTPGAVPYYNTSMLPVYRRLAGKLPSIVVYNGDTDPDVQFQGTEDSVRAIGLQVAQGGLWRPWFYKQRSAPVGLLAAKPPFWGPGLSHRPLPAPQLGGYVTDYDGNVSFVTVHGSGHLVPMFKPQVALHLFERVLRGGALSPPLDADELEEVRDDKFFGNGFMAKWVVDAQSPKYTDSPALAMTESTTEPARHGSSSDGAAASQGVRQARGRSERPTSLFAEVA